MNGATILSSEIVQCRLEAQSIPEVVFCLHCIHCMCEYAQQFTFDHALIMIMIIWIAGLYF